MVEHQTKRAGPFTAEEMSNMLAFLDMLTGEVPEAYTAAPELPPTPEKPPKPPKPTDDEG